MRILFFSFPYESAPGGGERYTEQTVEGLTGNGDTVTLVSSSRALLRTFAARGWQALPIWGGVEPVSKVSVAVFPLTVPFFFPLLSFILIWFRSRLGAQALVCLSLTEKLLATLPARLLGMRVIWVEHLLAGRSLIQNPFRGPYAALSRLTRVVTVSEAAADSLVALGVPRGRITVIHPGISPENKPPVASRPSDRPIIGIVSRLSKEKNVTLALRAFALVTERIPEAMLRIYGDGPERRSLERQAEELGIREKTDFLGYADRAGERCAEFDVLAVPSSRESFGLAALEAMRCGIPVVATEVGGLPELVRHGETGLLVPAEDDHAMADALLSLLRDSELRRRLGEAARADVAARFNLEKMQHAWIELFSSR